MFIWRSVCMPPSLLLNFRQYGPVLYIICSQGPASHSQHSHVDDKLSDRSRVLWKANWDSWSINKFNKKPNLYSLTWQRSPSVKSSLLWKFVFHSRLTLINDCFQSNVVFYSRSSSIKGYPHQLLYSGKGRPPSVLHKILSSIKKMFLPHLMKSRLQANCHRQTEGYTMHN